MIVALSVVGDYMSNQSAQLISCKNHILQLKMMLAQLPGNNLEDAGHQQYNQLPYERNIPDSIYWGKYINKRNKSESLSANFESVAS